MLSSRTVYSLYFWILHLICTCNRRIGLSCNTRYLQFFLFLSCRQQFVQSEPDQFKPRNGGKPVSSQQRTVEDRYTLNPEDRQYYIDMFKTLVRASIVRYVCRMLIRTDIFLERRQLAIFHKAVYPKASLINCFRCVIVIRIRIWM